MPEISDVARALAPSGIRRFFDLVAATEGVISLGVGEPDFVTPRVIVDAAIKSLRAGQTTATTSNYGIRLSCGSWDCPRISVSDTG